MTYNLVGQRTAKQRLYARQDVMPCLLRRGWVLQEVDDASAMGERVRREGGQRCTGSLSQEGQKDARIPLCLCLCLCMSTQQAVEAVVASECMW